MHDEQKSIKRAARLANYLSADSCIHTLVMIPTLKSTLVPSGCSAEETAGFEAPAVVIVSANIQHIMVKPSTNCVLLSFIPTAVPGKQRPFGPRRERRNFRHLVNLLVQSSAAAATTVNTRCAVGSLHSPNAPVKKCRLLQGLRLKSVNAT